MITPPSIKPVDDVHRYIQKAKIGIEQCIKEYKDEEATINCLRRVEEIPPYITSIIWQWLQESNPEFFNEYCLRLQLIRQIKIFNLLLNKQAQFVEVLNNPPLQPVYNPNLYHRLPPLSQFDQDLPSSCDGQFMKFPDMAVLKAANILPQDTLPSYPFCRDAGNNMNASPNCVVSDPNSFLHYGIFNDSNLMSQNYQCAFLSSNFPVNGNIPQMPMLHESPVLPSLMNKIDGPYKSQLLAHTGTKRSVYSPVNTEDENGTLTQLMKGVTMNRSPPST